MNRQEVAIAIAKISMTTKMLRYWEELKPETYVTALDSYLVHFGEWTEGIRDYLDEVPNENVYHLLRLIGPTERLQAYVDRYKDTMPTNVRNSLLVFIPLIAKIKQDGKAIHAMTKGDYRCLADGIDTPEARSLLQRAVDMNILDDQFQPKPDISRRQLKVLAFAVSKSLGYDKKYQMKWTSFDEQWPSAVGHLANIALPNRDREDMKLITDLYPEVDFTDLFVNPKDEYFKRPFSWARLDSLYRRLKKNGYISADTTVMDFHNIFKPALGLRNPVNWTGDERRLSLFVYLVLNYKGNLGIWRKAENCFLVNGQRPNRRTMAMFLTKIKKDAPLQRLRNEDVKLLNVIRGYSGDYSYICSCITDD